MVRLQPGVAAPRFADLPPIAPRAAQTFDIDLGDIEAWLARESKRHALDLDPDYQRGHHWTEEQQTRFVERLVRGDQSSRTIRWNHPGWVDAPQANCNLPETLCLVDGKQRLTAVLRAVRDEIPLFGRRMSEYADHRRILQSPQFSVQMSVHNLQRRVDVLRWYCDLNAGGTPHSPEEIQRVRALLAAEEAAESAQEAVLTAGKHDNGTPAFRP